LVKAETVALVVADNQSTPMSGTSADITVAPAGAARLGVTGITDPIVKGTASDVTVTAYDTHENVATSDNGTIKFTSTDTAAVLPSPDYTFTPTDNGTHTFPNEVSFGTIGEQSITATDNVSGSISGTQTGISVYIPSSPPSGDGFSIYYTEADLFGTDARLLITNEGRVYRALEATSEDGSLIISIPKDTTALGKDEKRLKSLRAEAIENPPAPPDDAHIIKFAYDFGPDGATFDPPITLTWKYDPDVLPKNVAEEDLGIAYYDEDTSEWIELDYTVDTENNVINASIAHFTTFAIIGTPKPAAFTLTHLDISPNEVFPGETINISGSVANTGGLEGVHTVLLNINGTREDEKVVTVAPGGKETVTFAVSKEEPGSYSVDINDLSGSFTVKEPLPPVVPAVFSLSALTVQPDMVEPKQEVTITVRVTNTGGKEGSHTVVLNINGAKGDEKVVTVAPGGKETVTFRVSEEEPGNYSVDINGLSGNFVVKEEPPVAPSTPPSTPPVKPSVNWPLIGGIIGAMIVVALTIIYFLRKRTTT